VVINKKKLTHPSVVMSYQIAADLSRKVFGVCRGSKDDFVELEALLEAHPEADVNLHTDDDVRSIHVCAMAGHPKSMRLLINARADLEVRTRGSTPLVLVCHGLPHGPPAAYLECAKLLIEHNADLHSEDVRGSTPLESAARRSDTKCMKLLIDAKVNVNYRNAQGHTSAMSAVQNGELSAVQLLVESNADLNVQSYDGGVALYFAIRMRPREHKACESGKTFAILSCNTNLMNIRVDDYVTRDMVGASIEEFQRIQRFIDEYHTVTNHALSEDVVVDKRVGRRGNGLYHEPLEQVLLYLGMSLTKDQTVNASIDGKTVTRALIPGHPTNANMWFELYKRASVLRVSKLPPGWGCVDPRQRASDNKKYEPQFTIKNTKKKKKKRR
jgi:hypothetical protein